MSEFYPGTWAERTPDKPAIVMAESGQVVTYAELDETANRLSQLFRAAGLQPGDHMAFCMENRAEYLPIMWGAHYAGLYYTAVSSRLTSEEIGYIVEDSGSRAFITSPYKADAVGDLADVLLGLDVRLSVGGGLPGFDAFEDAIATQPDEPLPDRVESLPMLYSSGTTGRPKGVKPGFERKPLGSGEPLMALLVGLFGAKDSSIYLSPAPLYHSAPLRYCTQFLRLGATVVVLAHFDAEQALLAIEKHRVTHSQWVPTMFVRMLRLPEETRSRTQRRPAPSASRSRCSIGGAR
jgi:acyl-CoA synthetase (AMP-forming)/AMP-acid ligase II